MVTTISTVIGKTWGGATPGQGGFFGYVMAVFTHNSLLVCGGYRARVECIICATLPPSANAYV